MERLRFGPNTQAVLSLLERYRQIDWFSAESYSEEAIQLLREHLDCLRPFGYGKQPLARVDRNAFVAVAIAQRKMELEWDLEDPVQEMYDTVEIPPDAPQMVVDALGNAIEWEVVKDSIEHASPYLPLVRVLELGHWFDYREDGIILVWRGESDPIR